MIPLLQGPKSSQVHKDRVGQTLPGAERGHREQLFVRAESQSGMMKTFWK